MQLHLWERVGYKEVHVISRPAPGVKSHEQMLTSGSDQVRDGDAPFKLISTPHSLSEVHTLSSLLRLILEARVITEPTERSKILSVLLFHGLV